MPDKRIRFLIEHIKFLANEYGTYVPVQKVADTLGQVSKQLQNALLFPKQPVKAGRSFGPGFNRAVDTRLAPFLRRVTFSADAAKVEAEADVLPLPNGRFALPAACAYVDYYDVPGAVTVPEVSGHALLHKLACPLTGPDAANPVVAAVEGGAKRLYPDTTPEVTVQYYEQVPAPVYALWDENDEDSYDDAASVDTGWNEDAEPELIARTLTMLGVPLRDPALQQAGVAQTQQDL